MAVAFAEADLLERAVEIEPALDPLPRTAERRLYQRLRDRDLRWVRQVRLGGNRSVSLVDLSASGALIDSPVPLRPASILTLQIAGAGVDTAVEFRVLRCQIGAIGRGGPTYRAACEFSRLIELPNARHAVPLEIPAANPSSGFVGLDLALKQLVERAVPSAAHALDAECMLHALRALHNRALKQPGDPIGSPLADLLDHVLPALETETGLPAVLRRIEQQLRVTVPQATLRLAGVHGAPPPGVRSTLIKLPGAAESQALVSIDIPRGVVLNDWQSRVVRLTSRVITLLQCFDAGSGAAPGADASSEEDTLSLEPAASDATDNPPAASGPQASWQKIVVRYAEGQILKGSSHDFSATRSHFSLWPSTTADANDRVIVPLPRLKAVFFVRDFAGNPGYVERNETDAVQHGRRIEVTLVDDEVITGRTLSYRPDGHGFFVVPADPNTNNIRVFVVSSSVRQVRFP
jgi:hypothetical protein